MDILVELRCAHVKRLRRCKPAVLLFDPPAKLELVEASILDDASDLVVEASFDAVVRLGQFIGDKQYSVDFAAQCPCHPDRRLTMP